MLPVFALFSLAFRLLVRAHKVLHGTVVGTLTWALGCARAALRSPAAAVRRVALVGLGGLQWAQELLAYTLSEPSPRQQVSRYKGLVARGQQRQADMRRRAEALALELQRARQDMNDMQRANDQLRDQLAEAQVALDESHRRRRAASSAAAPAGPAGAGSSKAAPAPAYAVPDWALHLAVALAAVGLRWWLVNEEDALQRKMMFAVLWPGVWLYAAVLFRCLPRSSPVRGLLTAGCYFVLGYIAHEALEHSVLNGANPLGGAQVPEGAAKLLAAAGARLGDRLQWLAQRANATAAGEL